MTYRIQGLKRAEFDPLFAMTDAKLTEQGAIRMKATGPGFPCRISLEDAPTGDEVILLNYTSHAVATPYRSSYAIFVRPDAKEIVPLVDTTPPVFEGRPIAMRGFDKHGMLKNAGLALPGQADEKIRSLFADPAIAYIHAHNAAHGCFSALIERD